MKKGKGMIRQQFLKATILWLCAVGLIIGSPMSAKAEKSVTEDGFKYSVLEDNSVEIIGYTGTETEVEIPSAIDGKNVTSIGSRSFYYKNDLTSVTIPASIKKIGDSAFSDCENLTGIIIPEGVENINDRAFWCCRKLTEIHIPASVTHIGESVFSGCNSLESIIVNAENTKYDSRNNCNAIIETETNTLVSGCKNTVIPEEITKIGNGAFSGMGMTATSVDLPGGLTHIGNDAFRGWEELESLTIPEGVTHIGESAFFMCNAISSIHIPASVTNIGYRAFNFMLSLNSITVDEENEVFDSRNNCNAIIETETNTLLQGCAITVIPENVTTIGDFAFFWSTNLKNVRIPAGVTSIGNDVYGWCSGIESIVVDSKNTVFDSRDNCNAIIETATNKLVYGCITTTIPTTVKCIGESAFYGKDMESLTIPGNVESLEFEAFASCQKLKKVTICEGVKSIGERAFNACVRLNNVTIPDSVTSIGDRAFLSCADDLVIYANADSYAATWAKENGFTVKDPVVEPEAGEEQKEPVTPVQPVTPPTSVPVPAVQGEVLVDTVNACTVKVTSADANNPAVDYVGSSADVSGKMTIPSEVTVAGITYAVTGIADNAMKGKNITQVTIPKTVQTIGKNAFKNCKKLTKVTIGTGTTEIKASAFENCTALKTVNINSKTLKTIGKKAFKGCKKLKTIKLKTTGLNKKSVKKNALSGTNKNLTIKVPKKYVKKYATYFKNKGNKTVKVKKG